MMTPGSPWKLRRLPTGAYHVDTESGAIAAPSLYTAGLVVAAPAMLQALNNIANWPAKVRRPDGSWTTTSEENLDALRQWAAQVLDDIKKIR